MRVIPPELADRIESGTAGLCHVWLVRRTDGSRSGFTDHDRDLTMDGVVCRAASGWTAGAADAGAGLEPGTASAAGVLDGDAVDEAEIAAGLWDGAEVELLRVDWEDPALFVRLWSGRISRLRREGEAFTAEVEGPLAALDRVAGRTYGRLCDASLGDGRCGIDLADPAFAGRACDKRWRTCVETFGNGVNFQGFPDIPGDDFLSAWPGPGERHDGGSRR